MMTPPAPPDGPEMPPTGLDSMNALRARTAALPDLIVRAHKAISRACKGRIQMSIPVQPDDDDMVLSVAVDELEKTRNALSASLGREQALTASLELLKSAARDAGIQVFGEAGYKAMLLRCTLEAAVAEKSGAASGPSPKTP